MGNEKKQKFTEGEKVLCYHGPLLYEAKIHKLKTKDRVTKFLVHYAGWNTKWDEWVADSRVMKYNDEGLKKQKELKQHHSSSRKGKKKDSKDDKPDAPVPSKRRKGRHANQNDSEPSYVQKMEVKIIIPQDLRRFLLDDCDFVTRQKQLVPLPKPEELTLKAVTDRFFKTKEEGGEDGKLSGSFSEVCRGICEYFDVMLGSQLLYKFERTQYGDILKEHPGKPLCEIYGCEHLLRLFVKMGTFLSYSCLDESSMEFVVSHIHDFLEFMTKQADDLFCAEYENSTPDYQRRTNV